MKVPEGTQGSYGIRSDVAFCDPVEELEVLVKSIIQQNMSLKEVVTFKSIAHKPKPPTICNPAAGHIWKCNGSSFVGRPLLSPHLVVCAMHLQEVPVSDIRSYPIIPMQMNCPAWLVNSCPCN